MTHAVSVLRLRTTVYFARADVLACAPQRSGFLERAPALNQINDQNDHSYYEQQMDQAAPDMPEKTQKPENKKNYEYSPKHKFIFGFVFPPRIVCSKPKEKLKAKS